MKLFYTYLVHCEIPAWGDLSTRLGEPYDEIIADDLGERLSPEQVHEMLVIELGLQWMSDVVIRNVEEIIETADERARNALEKFYDI